MGGSVGAAALGGSLAGVVGFALGLGSAIGWSEPTAPGAADGEPGRVSGDAGVSPGGEPDAVPDGESDGVATGSAVAATPGAANVSTGSAAMDSQPMNTSFFVP